MNRNELYEDAIHYFNNRVALKIFFEEMERKYKSYGRFQGNVSKKGFHNVDVEPLLQFMGIDPWEWDEVKHIKIATFIKHYESSKFEEIPLKDVVEAVLGRRLVSNKEKQEREEELLQIFVSTVENISSVYLEIPLKPFYKWYLIDGIDCLNGFSQVKEALGNMPKEYTKLPVFAYQQTGNPHAFDSTTYRGQLLLAVLGVLSLNKEQIYTSRVERENEIYAGFHLIKDDIMNFAAINGLVAFKKSEPMAMWRSACESNSPWNVPVRQLIEITTIRPNKGKKIILIENSGVFSVLLDKFPDLPIICTNGQFRYAIWLLLDRLVNHDVQLYYSGDFDPEGIEMASKLKSRYQDKVFFLAMDAVAYLESKPSVPLDGDRCKKLRNVIVVNELNDVKEKILELELAGYQEGIIERIATEIRQKFYNDKGLL
ncbi:hypothetical protein BMT55_03300 [Listeria newyorkensis]|uniref:TIGR02679 family protein n=1 Tax=Listeria newyorkensis TaxID=1497681 RepID=A0ABX4XPN2_9LIST|nr:MULTISPECIES: DUF2399 domain-containing protein [Listeria]KGL41340.1 hypothetical protein EP56_12215 [Listeriaceae bacterium FSL A5-0209]KGL44676.1 hypothetical protein EP58_04145 [Listeria newyorkensis]PNP93809.1 hypothetical protein BMT55_03300 [Listeria newyorkensis]RQW67311.1 DUF2399 domain-containing protein [Listeria sp. SHR_NRA_18]SQC50814.1 Protein of uncharacterised function C-terminus (DUF2399) [Listeria newyorkensis]